MRKSTIFILISLLVFACTPKKKVQPPPPAPPQDTTTSREVEEKKVRQVGDVVDIYNGVNVYYNGGVGNVVERNTAPDGYNLGLKYQCVEFVKRYYYEHFQHKMPDSYGDAKDFFDKEIIDGGFNEKRGLLQFKNPSKYKPEPDDILIWKGNKHNPFGHIAVISDTNRYVVEIVQQNPGPSVPPREELPYVFYKGKWKILTLDVVGWLRRKK